MAQLVRTEARVTLGARCLVGRSPRAHLRLDDARVSAEHASVFHDGVGWWVRDLSSRNGTWVNGVSVDQREGARLSAGDQVSFGSLDHAWTLEDASEPGCRLRRLSDGERLGPDESGLFELGAERPLGLLIVSDGRWWLETEDGSAPVHDGEHVDLQGERFALELVPVDSRPLPNTETADRLPPSIADLTVRFKVSRDEEHVEVSLGSDQAAVPLPPRSHHYLLLLLARQRVADAGLELAEPDQGWVFADDLARMAGISRENLNVGVWRLRQEVRKAGVPGAADIVQRRPGTRQLRLGTPHVELESDR